MTRILCARAPAFATGPCRKRSTAMSRRRWMLVPGLLGALVLQACGGGSEPGTADCEPGGLQGCGGESEPSTANCRPAGTRLRIKAGEPTHEFSPDCLAAPANKPFTIRLTNLDKSSHGQHNIEIEDVFEGEVIDGEGKSITYELGPLRAGKYKFVDSKHPFMGGTLVVKKSPPRTVTD